VGFKINPLGPPFDVVGPSGGSGSPSIPFEQTFNATTDWGVASGGYFTISITEASHGKGPSPIVSILEVNGLNFDKVEVDLITLTPTGNISFRVPETPDLRFAGKIIIIGE
jgi:hypothetical protein